MKRSEAIAFVSGLGFSGVEFTKLMNYPTGKVCQLEFGAFDPKVVGRSLGRATKHSENLFAFRLSKTRGIRVNTRINRVWLVDGERAIIRQLLGSV